MFVWHCFLQCGVDFNLPYADEHWPIHYNDVIMGAIAFQITSLTIVYSIVYSEQIKENIKPPRHWPLCGEFTGDRWIPRTNGQLRGKCFHLMTSSCVSQRKSHFTFGCPRLHENAMTWKRFLHYWPFVRGIHGIVMRNFRFLYEPDQVV